MLGLTMKGLGNEDFEAEEEKDGGGGRREKRKLSASRPAMSSQELMTSGSDRRDLGSGSGLGKIEAKVNRGGGVGGNVVVRRSELLGGGLSRVKNP